MSDLGPDPDLELVERIYDALEEGRPEEALHLARGESEKSAAGAEDNEHNPVVRFLAGVALLELDRPHEASVELERAVALDPDDAEFRANLAVACYAACRFEEASGAARVALELDDSLADAHYAMALAVERTGDYAAGDAHFARAAEIDPQAFPRPLRLGRTEFEGVVREASQRLPEVFLRRLDEVTVIVEDLPAEAHLDHEDGVDDPELLGLFVGVPLGEHSNLDPVIELPPRIFLFQRNLERCFADRERLEEEIARTLYHELGHYLGLDEEALAEMDLA